MPEKDTSDTYITEARLFIKVERKNFFQQIKGGNVRDRKLCSQVRLDFMAAYRTLHPFIRPLAKMLHRPYNRRGEEKP